MNENKYGIDTVKEKISQFYTTGTNHQDLMDFINDGNTLRMCFDLFLDNNQCLKHFGITGLISKIKKQLITEEQFLWLNTEINRHLYEEKLNLLYFIKLAAYTKLMFIHKSDLRSFYAVIKELPNTNENLVYRNQTLISNMFEIMNARDLPVPVLTNISQMLYKEAKEILYLILEISVQFINNMNLQQIGIKSISYLFNYCTITGRSMPELQNYVLECIQKPELFADAVDLFTNILVVSKLSNEQMEYVIRYSLMRNPVVGKIIQDQKDAVRQQIEWKDRDVSEKQMAYALCEYIGSLMNLSFDGILLFFTASVALSAAEKEALEYLLNLVLQMLSIDGDIPKYNDIFIGIVNNVHILLEELAEVYDDNSQCVVAFQRNLIDIFFSKLKHPFSFGDKDIDMDEFLDNRDNVGFAFESMNPELLADWLRQKLFYFSTTENVNVSEVETVFFLYSQIPEFSISVISFDQLHGIFKTAFLLAGDFQESFIDTYMVLLKELFPKMSESDLDILIGFLWDVLKNYEPAMFSAASLLSSIYQWEKFSLITINSHRETQTMMLIKELLDSSNSWKEYSINFYAIVGRLACTCHNNDELNNLSSAFITTIFSKLSQSIQNLINAVQHNEQQQSQQQSTIIENHRLPDHPDEIIISNQLSLIASFLSPISRFPNNCSQFILEMIGALLELLNNLSTATVIISVEFYSSLLRLTHSALLTSVVQNYSISQKFSEMLMSTMNNLYKSHNGQSRPACLDLMVAVLNNTFQLIVTYHQDLATLIFKYFSEMLLDYTFNRFRNNYYMPAFISRCIKFVHSALTEHGLSTRLRSSESLCFEHSPNTSRAYLSVQKIEWLEQNVAVLKQINWSNIFFIPSFYLGDLTPDVNRASIKLLISSIKCRSQLPDYILTSLINNLQLIIFNVVKLFSFGVTELGDMVSLITAFRDNMSSESVKMLELVNNEPIVQANPYLQTVTKLVHYLLTGAKLNNSTMRIYISNFQESVKLLQPPQYLQS